VQIDAPSYTEYVDEPSLEAIRNRGEDPLEALERGIQAENAVIEGIEGAVFGIHICRGNAQSNWHRQGSYEAIAERLFGGLAHQRLLLEYDDERPGDFKPLRFAPKGKVAVLGLITTKAGELESADDLKRRIDEAARYLPLEQLALSPQCGFATVMESNLISEDDQWRKLDLMLEVSREVWG
jgi:5-methyltetrahydropteroyltriglutamate--homocysteine methyltransferase